MARRWKKRRMYAVSKDGIGLIAGTLAHSRGAAIDHFLHHTGSRFAWGNFKSTGYRTVAAMIEVMDTRTGTKRHANMA